MKKRLAILFVCTGNICRSPTAEGVLRRLERACPAEQPRSISSSTAAESCSTS